MQMLNIFSQKKGEKKVNTNHIYSLPMSKSACLHQGERFQIDLRRKKGLWLADTVPVQMMVSMKKNLLGDNAYHDLLIPTDKAYLGFVESVRLFPSNTRIAVRCKS